jgi:thiaminase
LAIHPAVYSWLHKTWYDLYSPDRYQDLVDWYHAFDEQLGATLEKSDKSPEEQEEIYDKVVRHFLDIAHIMDLVTTKLEGEE